MMLQDLIIYKGQSYNSRNCLGSHSPGREGGPADLTTGDHIVRLAEAIKHATVDPDAHEQQDAVLFRRMDLRLIVHLI
jgi:hypothetical protein